ncbi:MAG: hypothetical protein JRD69_09570 [Deltaproteobacteria bacterium]|nr:hypothetical protein [Deltaproteobacteria bacterium]
MCIEEECVESLYSQLICEGKEYTDMGCVDDSQEDTICAGYDGKRDYGGCDEDWPWGYQGDYMECWDYVSETTECLLDPVCPDGYDDVEVSVCVPPCADQCAVQGVTTACLGNNVITTTCADTNGDGCLEETTTTTTCEGICNSGACESVAPEVAVLSASASNKRTSGYYTYYTSTISETAGVGVTINSRQKCYSASDGNNWCDSVREDITTYYNANYISPNGQISNPTNYVYFNPGYTYTTTETFNGLDDNGNNVQVM